MKSSMVPGLRALRMDRGVSRAEFAEILDVGYHTIYSWELGICAPRLENLLKMARAFGVTPNDLLEYEVDARDTRAMQYREGMRRYLS